MDRSDKLVDIDGTSDVDDVDKEAFNLAGVTCPKPLRPLLGFRRYVSQLTSTTPTLAAAQITSLGPASQGFKNYQILNDMYYLVSLFLDVSFYPNGVGSAEMPLYRVAVVFDRQSNQTLPAFLSMFKDVDAVGATILDSSGTQPHPLAGKNVEYKERFAVLYDKCFMLPWLAATNQPLFGSNYHYVNQHIRAQIPLHYIGIEGINDYSGDLLLVISTTSTTATWKVSTLSRLVFRCTN